MYIKHTQFEHGGLYTCEAKTALHTASRSAIVTVIGKYRKNRTNTVRLKKNLHISRFSVNKANANFFLYIIKIVVTFVS